VDPTGWRNEHPRVNAVSEAATGAGRRGCRGIGRARAHSASNGLCRVGWDAATGRLVRVGATAHFCSAICVVVPADRTRRCDGTTCHRCARRPSRAIHRAVRRAGYFTRPRGRCIPPCSGCAVPGQSCVPAVEPGIDRVYHCAAVLIVASQIPRALGVTADGVVCCLMT
jgi:hypothetical protein